MWEGVGDWPELQHIDPRSIGHNSVSFAFSWAAQQVAWWPTLLGAGFLYRIWSPTDLISNCLTSCLHPGYIIVRRPPSCGRHKSHSFNPSTVKVIISWYSLTGCTCYLHRYISYFDSLARLEVNMQHNALEKRGKIFHVTSYLETKSFKTMQAKFHWKFN